MIRCSFYVFLILLLLYSLFNFRKHFWWSPNLSTRCLCVLLWTRVWQVLFMVFGPFHWMQIKKSEIKLHHTVQKKDRCWQNHAKLTIPLQSWLHHYFAESKASLGSYLNFCKLTISRNFVVQYASKMKNLIDLWRTHENKTPNATSWIFWPVVLYLPGMLEGGGAHYSHPIY